MEQLINASTEPSLSPEAPNYVEGRTFEVVTQVNSTASTFERVAGETVNVQVTDALRTVVVNRVIVSPSLEQWIRQINKSL